MRERDSKGLAGYSSLAGGDLPQHVGLERERRRWVLDSRRRGKRFVRVCEDFGSLSTASLLLSLWYVELQGAVLETFTPRNRICALFEI
jgi:hypothetical protein